MAGANPWIAGLSMAAAAAPLFFGENNIFSGKARQASRELEKNFRASQSMGLPSEYNQYLQNKLSQANTGIPGAALGLYQQQAGRAQAGQLSALGNRRSALAGISSIAQAGNDAAANLAAMQGNAMQQNREAADQALFQMGGLKYQEQLRKQQEAADYWGNRKAESNQSISSSLAALGSAAGSALSSGAFKGTPSLTDIPGQAVTQAATKGMSQFGATAGNIMGLGAALSNMKNNAQYNVPQLLKSPSVPNALWSPNSMTSQRFGKYF